MNKVDRQRQKELCRNVDKLLSLKESYPKAKTAHQKTALQRQIDATDREIDLLVYELYGLTDEEIAIVEQATA
jgi:hypothetical protein